MNENPDHEWERQLRSRLHAATLAAAPVDAPPWGTIRSRGRRRARRRRTVVVAGVGSLGALGVAAGAAVTRDPRPQVTPVDVASAPATGPDPSVPATSLPVVPPSWSAEEWMGTRGDRPVPSECAGYAAAHPRARSAAPNTVPTRADVTAPTAVPTSPGTTTPPTGAHSEYHPAEGRGFRRIVGGDGRVLFELPTDSVDSLSSQVREAGGWAYFGIVSHESGSTTIMRASTDGGGSEELGVVGQYAAFELSPDARHLVMAAIEGAPSLVVRDLVGGTQHEVTIEGDAFAALKDIAWDPDGDHVFVQVASNGFIVDCRTGAKAVNTGANEEEIRANQQFWVIDPMELRVFRVAIDAATTTEAELIAQG